MQARSRNALAAIALGALLSLVGLELVSQVYVRQRIFPQWDREMAHPNYLYHRSAAPGLTYELRPHAEFENEAGQRLRINAHSIRENSDELFPEHHRVAVLGDSVVFGFMTDQNHTLADRLQQRVDPEVEHTKVFNFGMGGMNLAEVVAFLRARDAVYDIHETVFLLNWNDLAPRDSVYEGADNGLYRMHRRPSFMTPWVLRKLVYRYQKNEGYPSWYQWMFDGNRDWAFDQLAELADYCRGEDIHLAVVPLPSALSLTGDDYTIETQHAAVTARLTALDVPFADPWREFLSDAEHRFDHTDHFRAPGNLEMAREIHELLEGAR